MNSAMNAQKAQRVSLVNETTRYIYETLVLKLGFLATLIDFIGGRCEGFYAVRKLLWCTVGNKVYILKKNADPDHAGFSILTSPSTPLMSP